METIIVAAVFWLLGAFTGVFVMAVCQAGKGDGDD